MPSACTTMKPSSARSLMVQFHGVNCFGTYWSPGPE